MNERSIRYKTYAKSKELNFSEERLSQYFREVKDEFWEDIKENNRMLLKEFIQLALQEDIRIHIGAGWHQRNTERIDWRNGYYRRGLETGLGYLSDLQVPRLRKGGITNRVFRRYQRRKEEVEEVIREVFLKGVSTRQVGKVLRTLLGTKISAQTVSNVCESLDREVGRYHCRNLKDDYIYLIVDGLVLKVKDGVRYRSKVILCAYGIMRDGKRELIDFMLVEGESENAWTRFVNDLYRRGLEGERLKLIVTDGNPGLENALEIVFPRIPHQRCWAHKLRNVANKLPKKYQEECITEARTIYSAPNRKSAVRRYFKWAKKWRKFSPKAVDCLEKDLGKLLTFFDFPQPIRKKIRTTNVIERSFREIRRRIRPMSCFTNNKSCERIIYGVINNLNNQWEDKPLKEITQFS